MNLKEFASQNNLTLAKLKEVCNQLFGSIPEILSDEQINQILGHLTEPNPNNNKLALGFKPDSSAIRNRPKNTTAITLGQDYQKLYQLVPAEFQARLDKLPECDRLSVLLSACEGINLAELQHLTKEAFESARLTQLQNQSNSAKLQQSKALANQRNEYSDFDVNSFFDQLKAQEILAELMAANNN